MTMARLADRRRSCEFPVMTPRLPDLEAIAPYLRQIDANRWYSNSGPLADLLAWRLAERFGGTKGRVCPMANATLALTAALLESAEQRPGAACILPSWTFAASAHAVRLSGLRPYFVDVDPSLGQLTPALAEAALADHDVAAAMVVSAFGQPVDPAPWEAFRDRHGIAVVIDAAAGFDSVRVSTLATVVSLHATKPVACGEGAFVLCGDVELVERLRRRANFGFDSGRCAQTAGLNAKMSEYHAAVGNASLDSWTTVRQRLMAVGQGYRERFADLPALTLQSGWADTWIGTTLNVLLPEPEVAETMCAKLAAVGVEARRWWGAGCHSQPAFRDCRRGPLPATETLALRTLGLPFSAQTSRAAIDEIIRRLDCALQSRQRDR
jgi:dTDP-4-amino-4,6-dideoxygalactose transaminase